MPAPAHSLPDITVGHHPDHGIVAATPTQSAAAQWMLERLEFQPVPGHPSLYALTDQHREGAERIAWAIKLLRAAEYRVDTDLALGSEEPAQPLARHRATTPQAKAEPAVAFAEHPRLGVVAATASTMEGVDVGGPILEAHGWRFNHRLDIYALPSTVDRSEALDKVALASRMMSESAGLEVAIHPDLAFNVLARRFPTPAPAPAPGRAPAARHEGSPAFTTHRFPVSAAALAKSPARASQPGTPPVATPAAPATGVDPRIAFSRPR